MDEKYNALSCIQGECGSCGNLSLFPRCNNSNHNDKVIQWRRFTDVDIIRPDGLMSRRPILTIQATTFKDLDAYIQSCLYKYKVHTFRQTWLARQFKACKEDFPVGSIVFVIDFAENYAFHP